MYISPEAERLLHDIEHAHRQLLQHFHGDESHLRGFRAVYEALESAVGDMDEAHLEAAAADGGWSPARILLHIATHDQQIEEATRRGLEHMVEHALEHASSLWRARMSAEQRAATGSADE
ncbi:MAG: hypothetical protein WEB52_05185 [Dehalococcoidia bacterium]